jgi:hypothetical protein
MSKVDWSLAPEGATHKETSCQNGFWYKFDFHNNQACFWSGKGWTNPISADAYNDGSMDTMEPRPAKPWSGPEDGLPPIGFRCEAGIPHTSGPDNEVSIIWIEGSVIAYYEIKGNAYAWFAEDDGFYPPAVLEFRAIKTPAQLAADKRETAIRELMDIAQVDCRVTAARLVDAGFKREAV